MFNKLSEKQIEIIKENLCLDSHQFRIENGHLTRIFIQDIEQNSRYLRFTLSLDPALGELREKMLPLTKRFLLDTWV